MTKATALATFIIKLTLIITIISVLFYFIPIKIALPSFLYDFLIDSPLTKVCSALDFLFPVSFLIECILFIFLLKNIGVIFGAIKWAYNLLSSI